MTSGFVTVAVEHFGGMVTSWPPEMLDVSVSPFAQNVRFTQGAVSVREGLSTLFATGNARAILGIADLGPESTQGPLLMDGQTAYWESPRGSGVLAQAPLSLAGGGPVNSTTIFGRAYLAAADSAGLQGGAQPLHWDGANFDSVTPAVPTAALQPGDATTAGNIAAGLRYVVVLFQMRDGSLFLSPYPGSWTASGGKQAVVGNIPVGPPSCVARVLAFTVAGGSSAGPYFYIGTPQTVNGVSETATTIEDNLTTSATFNFDDNFLGSSTDVTDYFRQTQLPSEAGVAYSQLTGRLMWWGEAAQPSLLRFSEAADGGLYYGDTGFVLVANGDGSRITGAFEFRGGLYCVKERSLYRITPNNGDPATWTVSQVSATAGCCGPRAFAVQNEFVLMVNREGVHLFSGGPPQRVSEELLGPAPDRPGLWEQVNWAAGGLFWLHVDPGDKCARAGLAMEGATGPSKILKLSYLDGWEPSLRFSTFTARYHYFPGRRYSLDSIAASGCWTLERTAIKEPWAFDSREAVRQIALASASADGIVMMLDANADTDRGAPIQALYRTGAISAAQKLQFQRNGVELVGLVQVRAAGATRLELWAVSGIARRRAAVVPLAPRATGDHSGMVLLAGESVSLELRSAAGRWRCLAMYCYTKPLLPLRPGTISPGVSH